ncbi:MAG: bifunctional methylenetetrahydrofolate dehydrogenase/methenyltetrahydrofolate cyclohydrolase FolD [Acidobacteria bacterium]|nr:bifunctional methylenetetrahydrofolate dehydrogenase/methenyltetrahydrofolate cyclohydrolase FolD [Acidobacteriota bacterium]
MTAQLIEGKTVAEQVESELRSEIAELAARGITPGIAVIRVGNDPASELYVRSKARKAEELGLRGTEHHLPEDTTEEKLADKIDELNSDDSVDGILLQLPVPAHLNSDHLLQRIAPEKDVDGFHPVNVGNLQLGRPALVACTPAGAIRLIESTGESIEGRHAVVVGRSNIVGKPVAALLLQKNATVTICHSRTRDLAGIVRQGDIVIAAVGRPYMITGDMIREGAIVIDVGINRVSAEDAPPSLPETKRDVIARRGSTVVGDVEFDSAVTRAGWITPVPGGVGPMTIAMLMKNTVEAARNRRR